ncbi:hypothetical protein BDK92_5101 [Micromonospora pisi]|uniref:Uncharacterized protein n=1 Tax=Micromonospora pisi TaxID=589240 RepID=A0A495JNZ4_9ACTN|nr:hypothetical protein [Micromonospora pisi]RKR90720.1 hypothetical protein BDK92_5101 [Micromonospora pisi]
MPSESRKARAAAARKAMERARQQERRQRRLIFGAAIGLAVAVIVAVSLVVSFDHPGSPASARSAARSIPATPLTTAQGRTEQPPWSAPAETTTQVRAAGLPMLDAEGTVEHIHAHLDVIVDGKPVVVPAQLGIDQATGEISPLHTHDTTGVLHIESPVQADFSLGQLFTEWQVALSDNQIGGLHAGDGKVLQAYVNGKAVTGNPAGIIMHAHDEIAIVYGTAAQQANPPSSYAFPAGD